MAFKFYGVVPKIPIRFRFLGDRAAAANLVGFGKRQLSVLTNQMGFQNLPTGKRETKLNNGISITCTKLYNETIVSIYVPKRLIQKADLVPLARPLLYYYRIKNLGTLWDETPDNSAQLETDRLIVWIPKYNKGIPIIPGQERNSANGFIPGQGTIKFDVDVISQTVHYPQGLSKEEKESLISTAENYINKIPGFKSVFNKTDDWFDTGAISDPLTAYSRCSNDYDITTSTSFHLNTPYVSPIGDNFYHVIDPYIADILWFNTWCPLPYPGSGEDKFNSLSWPSLGINYIYYGDTTGLLNHEADPVPVIWSVSENLYKYLWESSGYHAGLFVSDVSMVDTGDEGDPPISFYKDYKYVLAGSYFTGKLGSLGAETFPSFFNFVMGVGGKRDYSLIQGLYDDISDTPIEPYPSSVSVNVNNEGIASIGWYLNTINTPLEQLSNEDVLYQGKGIAQPCTDSPCFNMATTFYYVATNDDGSMANIYNEAPEIFPCDPDTLFVNGRAFRETTEYDSTFSSSFNILDSGKITQVGLTNLVSLSTYIESSMATKGGMKHDLFPTWWCSGIPYDFINQLPTSLTWDVGILIYIFAPTYLWVDLTEDIKVDFWDIHSARTSADVINAFRVLELEEYILDLLGRLKDWHSTLSDIPLYEDRPGGIYTLNDMGYILTDGFIY